MCVICMYFTLQSINVNDDIDGRPPILYAADYGQFDVIKYLISAGANVNVSNSNQLRSLFVLICLFCSLKTNMELRQYWQRYGRDILIVSNCC